MRTCFIFLTMLAVGVLTSCKSPHQFNRNIASGREIVLSVNVYSQDALDQFPASLDDLVSEKILKTVPSCLCQDGKMRDFIYMPGFEPTDGNNWVILATPPEMDSRYAIIFRIDARGEIVKKAEAALALQKSRDYLKQRDRNKS